MRQRLRKSPPLSPRGTQNKTQSTLKALQNQESSVKVSPEICEHSEPHSLALRTVSLLLLLLVRDERLEVDGDSTDSSVFLDGRNKISRGAGNQGEKRPTPCPKRDFLVVRSSPLLELAPPSATRRRDLRAFRTYLWMIFRKLESWEDCEDEQWGASVHPAKRP